LRVGVTYELCLKQLKHVVVHRLIDCWGKNSNKKPDSSLVLDKNPFAEARQNSFAGIIKDYEMAQTITLIPRQALKKSVIKKLYSETSLQ
jgi:hypothetical protein